MRFFMQIFVALLVLLYPFVVAAQIKFGSTLMLSGSGAYLGKNAQEGMELARAEINAAGGLSGQPLEILYEDLGEINLIRAVSAAQKMMTVDKVTVLLPMVTEDASAIYPLARKKGIISMAIYAGAPDLTLGKPLLYQISSSDEVQMRLLADYAKARGARNACVLTEDGAYTVSIASAMQKYWQTIGGVGFLDLKHNPGNIDFKPFLLKARGANCESLFLLTSPNGQGTALKQIRETRWNVTMLGFDWSEDQNILNMAGPSSEGLIYAKYLNGTPDFIERYKKKYGREPAVPAALAYDAVRLLGSIVAKEGPDTSRIDAALRSLRDYPGASGKIAFEDGTRRDREAELWTIRAGKPELLLSEK